MTVRSDDFRKQVNFLWKNAVGQLEDVKDLVLKSRGRIDIKLRRLRLERDRLLTRLGEQTYRLANQGKLPMPSLVRRTVDRLNVVIDGIVETEALVPDRAKKGSAESTGKAAPKGARAPARKAAKKTTTKTAAASTKTVSKVARKKKAAKKTKATTSRRTASSGGKATGG